MSAVAFQWQADGPATGARGISDDPQAARRFAAARLRSGAADCAIVEEVIAEIGMRTLMSGYHRTGRGWRAKIGAGGRVRWVPVVGGMKVTAA